MDVKLCYANDICYYMHMYIYANELFKSLSKMVKHDRSRKE